MVRRDWVLILALFLLTAASAAQMRLDKVMAEAAKPSKLEENLRVLTDEVGGRVPGTPAMGKAIAWATAAMKEAGADRVYTEEFTMSTGWAEGATSVEVLTPAVFKVRAVSNPWVPAFTPGAPVRLVDVGSGSEADFAKAGDIAGAVALVHSKVGTTWEDLFMDYMQAPPVIARAEKARAGALAFISTREHDLLYRHINLSRARANTLPTFIVAREDGERIARLLAAGKKVSAKVSMPNKLLLAFKTANVIGEIRGSEKPDEYVILGAHLDSWELGTGALDNGCNSALVVDALRAIKASGLTPRRTIRFILYSGEEQGMLGSRDYAIRHRDELDRTVAALIFDAGSGEVTGFSVGGRKDAQSAAARLLAPLQRLGVRDFTTDAFFGTDNLDLLLEGVPTLVANQKEANYMVNYHASSDTFDKVDLVALRRHTIIAAASTFAVADAAERIAPRQSAADTGALLKETGLDEQLKRFGTWAEWEQIAARRK